LAEFMTPERTISPRQEPESEERRAIQDGAARTHGRLLQFPAQHQEAVGKPARRHSKAYLLGEAALLFLGLPLALFFHAGGALPLLPTLWTVAAVALVLLLRDPSFDRRQLWNAGPLRRQLPQILVLFAVGVVVITVLVREYAPWMFEEMVRNDPRLWAYIMVSYPFASVYPQSLIYRAFFFHRYEPVLRPVPGAHPWKLILASAASFAFVHIIFHNWIAVAMTFIGGVLFAVRYLNTRSLCVSCVEHTLYGWLLFTVGLGQFFIAGTV
jgi:membrane protease YdiL (CAAX protease family)